jgi:hypothetical protein
VEFVRTIIIPLELAAIVVLLPVAAAAPAPRRPASPRAVQRLLAGGALAFATSGLAAVLGVTLLFAPSFALAGGCVLGLIYLARAPDPADETEGGGEDDGPPGDGGDDLPDHDGGAPDEPEIDWRSFEEAFADYVARHERERQRRPRRSPWHPGE